jgi:uncharacterized membrane protein
MAIIGRLHPLLIHFPIALVISAVLAEATAAITGHDDWHAVAIGNIRVGAAFALIAAIAGWRLALDPVVDASSMLEWHRWLGTTGAGVALVAAMATGGASRPSPASARIFRLVLFAAGILVAAAGHLGGVLVWGTNFLRP